MSTNNKGKKFSKKNKSKSGKSVNPPESISAYRGPVITKSDTHESDVVSILLPWQLDLGSTAGGVIANVISNNPSNSGNWAQLSVTWSEFRVLGMRVEFYPSNRYNKTTTVCRPLATIVDRSDAPAPLASYALASQFASFKMLSLEDPWVREVKMDGIEDSGFLYTTFGTNVTYSVSLWADGLSISTSYGLLMCYLRVQFRGEK